jgi:hypothetical protein
MSDKSVTIPVVWSVTGKKTLTIPPRFSNRRGAMEFAVSFALEHPGSVVVVWGVTAVSLNLLFRGRDGLRHCLSDRMINDIDTRWAGVRLANGSRILGFTPSANDVHRLDGLSINFVVAEQHLPIQHREAWRRMQTRIRPLQGFENCIIYITDDEADGE